MLIESKAMSVLSSRLICKVFPPELLSVMALYGSATVLYNDLEHALRLQ